jgi:NADH dehydrogenase
MILLTGATGFVGGNLVRELLEEGFRVRCLVRDPARAAALKGLGCELVSGDVTDRASVIEAIDDKIEAAAHLVGIITETRRATFRAVHTEGTRNVVEACSKKGVKRYLHVSALGTRPRARSEYHRTKWEAEEIIRGSALVYTIFRPSIMFGPGDQFVNTLASVMKISPVIMVPGGGANLFQPVFIKDISKIMAASLKTEGAKNKVFEVGGPERVTFDGLIDTIASVLGKRVLKVHVPLCLMRLGAAMAETVLSSPPISRDQLLMLEEDNVTDENPFAEVFGIKPLGLEEALRSYMK